MTIKGSCHCKATAFEVSAAPENVTRCTCSFCSKRGHLYAYFRPDQVTIAQADSDAAYRWNTRKIANHFCSACGCDVYADAPAFQPEGSWDGKQGAWRSTPGSSMISRPPTTG